MRLIFCFAFHREKLKQVGASTFPFADLTRSIEGIFRKMLIFSQNAFVPINDSLFAGKMDLCLIVLRLMFRSSDYGERFIPTSIQGYFLESSFSNPRIIDVV